MNIVESLLNMPGQTWYLVSLLLIVSILKSRWLKGVSGDFLVNRLLSKLPEGDYTLIKDITLPTADGTTQVDHIIVSKYGIFVVETKNMKGWVFGSARQKQWTQKIYRHCYKFQNPLHQNYKHIKTLESLLDCSEGHLHSVVVFTGNSTFKSKMPSNVTYACGCIRYIQQFNEVVFDDEEYSRLVESINHIKLKRGLITDIKHRKHVKEVVVGKVCTNQCPKCGS